MARTDADRHYEYYPAFLDLRRKCVVVVGGGEIATGKVRGVLPCGALPLIVIAPEVTELIEEHSRGGNLRWIRREYRDGDLKGADLVFAATDDREVNAAVASEARRRRIPVLAVDDIPNCDLIAPAVVRRGSLTVAISTHGRSPAMASYARRQLERALPEEWGALLEVAAGVRERLGGARRRIRPESWQEAFDEELLDLVRAGDVAAARDLLWRRLVVEAVA